MKSIVPLHIITGFLGVGKTTAILNLMGKLKDKEIVAVVVNERGEVGLDGILMNSANKDLEIREVTGGCICCTAGPMFVRSLSEVLEKVHPDRIFMEPSGIAQPGEIVDLINSDSVRERLEMRPIITLVDPSHFLKPFMMEWPVFRNQVEAADILVANRCDLGSHSIVEAFYEKAKGLFPPKRAIFSTSFGRLPDDILSITGYSPQMSGYPLASERDLEKNCSHSRETMHSTYSETGWTWPPTTVFVHRNLSDAFEAIRSNNIVGMHGKVERAKGVFHTEKGWYLMELALDTPYEREIQYRRDNRCQIILSGNNIDDSTKIFALLESCIKK